eukprot:gene9327-biopygen13759
MGFKPQKNENQRNGCGRPRRRRRPGIKKAGLFRSAPQALQKYHRTRNKCYHQTTFHPRMARDTAPDRISATLQRQRQCRLPQPRGGGGGVKDTTRQFTSGHARTFHWNTLRGETAASPPSNSFSSVDSREGEGPCMHFRVRDPQCACSERLHPAKKGEIITQHGIGKLEN